MKVFVKGLNMCVLRNHKVQQYRNFILANGHELVSHPNDSDVTLLYTCGFRSDVRDNSLSEIRRYQEEYDTELIVCGCLPDIIPEMLKESFKGRIVNWRDDSRKMEVIFGVGRVGFDELSPVWIDDKVCDDAEQYRTENPNDLVGFHDQFIKLVVSEGCNLECSYCTERLTFPPFRSFPEIEVVEACRELVVKTGHYEVVLLADMLGEYGKDIGSSFPQLVRRLKSIDQRLTIALNNFHPSSFLEYFDEMKAFMLDGTICHINIPVQSASDRILKLMRRPYSKADMIKTFSFFQQINFTEFDTHIIVGFPGETEEDLGETLDFILTYRPKHVQASRYMEVPGLPSALLPSKVDEEMKTRRLKMAEERMKAASIICNSDDNELVRRRFEKLNRI
jgi:MiaB/RimO family radical SAM methylthiotransferase